VLRDFRFQRRRQSAARPCQFVETIAPMTIRDAGSMTACIVLRCSIGLTLPGSPPKIASPK
jgi:hypothetical protein